MTYFSQLECLEKSAMQMPPQPQPGKIQTYATPVPGKSWGWGAAELGADIAAGTNPVTGVPWFGGKAINDFARGRWGSAFGNLGMGALSFLGMGGVGSALSKGALRGTKALGMAASEGAGMLDPKTATPAAAAQIPQQPGRIAGQ